MKIRILGFAGGGASPMDGMWVRSFDPDAFGGMGHVRGTHKPEEALNFETFAEAMEFWRTVSRTRPLRSDGKPNRPLTAFSVEILR